MSQVAECNQHQDVLLDTIIVGGGMSALGCAHRLRECSKPFLMITPEIGGRVRASDDGVVNLGAYYVTADYEWTLPLVKLGGRLHLSDAWFHSRNQRYRLFSPRLVKHLPALWRFMGDLKRFRKHYNRMNGQADQYSRHTLIHANPLLMQTYYQSAAEYIARRRLKGLFQDFIDPLLWATFFCDPRQVSTFFVLAASLPLIVPMYTFEFDAQQATDDIAGCIDKDRVTEVDLSGPHPRITTSSGLTHRCHNLVMATPADVTNQLLGNHAQPIRKGIEISYCRVTGELRDQYRGQRRNFFNSQDATVISRESDGSYLYYYQEEKLPEYFESYEVVDRGQWTPALFFHGPELIHSNPTTNVYIASDHDVPNMENAYLGGRYAANLVLRESRVSQHDWTDSQGFQMWAVPS